MTDRAKLARKIAIIRDAGDRIGEVLPASVDDFVRGRTAREVVALNLFVAGQSIVDLAARHVQAAGWPITGTPRQLFGALAEQGILSRGLADALGVVSDLPDLVLRHYRDLDWPFVCDVARTSPAALLEFCDALIDAAD